MEKVVDVGLLVRCLPAGRKDANSTDYMHFDYTFQTQDWVSHSQSVIYQSVFVFNGDMVTMDFFG